MALTSYLVRAFEHPHEGEMFDRLVNELTKTFERFQSPNFLVGNLLIDGRDLDALLVTENTISVIEMKAHGGELTFRENLPWVMDGVYEVKGGSWPNPFQQVRAYRMAVRNFFHAHESNILGENRAVEWQHTNAVVVFGNPVQFNESQLSYSLNLWLHITDLPNVGTRIGKLSSPKLKLTDDELVRTREVLGLSVRQVYCKGLASSTTSASTGSTAATTSRQPSVIYLKELGFRETEYRLRTWGGERSIAAQRIRELLEQMRQGVEALSGLAAAQDPRIDGAVRYKISPNCELLVIHAGLCLIPATAGTVDEVEGWLNTHTGLLVGINTESGRIEITATLGQRDIPVEMATQALSTESQPFLSRVTKLNLEELGIPKLVRNALMELDEAATVDDIKDTLDAVPITDHRLFLFDIINLIRAGDTSGANARIGLRTGGIVPIQDAGQFVTDTANADINSDQSFILNEISKEKLEKLLDPERFHDWMLFLHPDQKTFVNSTYDRPVVLTGVSGSGKTCILVHRAQALTKKYPGQKIGIMTLSKSLAGLLQNLVNQLCDKEERQFIEVLPFYDHFKKCLLKLGISVLAEQFEKLLPSHALMNTTLHRHVESWPRGMVWDCDPISREQLHENWEEFYMQRNPDVLEHMKSITQKLEAMGVDASRYLEEELPAR